jgi:hypothetical protein
MPSEGQLCKVSISKAVIPLSADTVEKLTRTKIHATLNQD